MEGAKVANDVQSLIIRHITDRKLFILMLGGHTLVDLAAQVAQGMQKPYYLNACKR